jgi:beta-galactosidase
MNRLSLLIACWLLLVSVVSAQAQHLVTDQLIWIEGEQPDATKVEFDVSPSARPQLLSDGKMLLRTLGKNQIPKQPWQLSYTFNVKHTDTYAFWIRLGYEWVRAPFDWQIDGGDWQHASADLQTTQVMELTTWNEIAWADYGDVKLNTGRHTLTLRFSEGGLDGRMMVGIDCIALGRAGFDPARMYHIPQQPIDAEAARQVYQFEHNTTANLSGLWQVARFDDPDMDTNTYEPVTQLPDLNTVRWLGMNVPGKGRGAWSEREELSFGHRLLYQTHVDIPAASDRSYQLQFASTNWIVSVFINGKLAATHKSVLVPWSVDVTDSIVPGKVNSIIVAVKSPWYAIDVKAPKGRTSSLDHARNTPGDANFAKNRSYVAPVFPSTKGEGNGLLTGIIGPVTLTTTGSAYVDDVFVQTKVSPDKQLTAQITLHNSSTTKRNVQWHGSIVDHVTQKTLKTGLNLDAVLEANATQTLTIPVVNLSDAKLWWPEDHAQLYDLQSQLLSGGKVIDQHVQTFGMREVSIRGKDFLLNGIPWHFWNWVAPGSSNIHTPAQWLEAYHAQSDRFHRIAQDHDRVFGSRENALNFFDANGVPGRLSTCIDGMFITHDLNNPLVWENFQEHVTQVVKAYRNHPSIMMYSLGNEMMFVTAFLRNGQNYREIEQKMAHLHDVAKELDPTRASFQDGGGDLGGLGEINCQHYSFAKGASFPLAAYDYPVGQPDGNHHRAEVFKWSGKNPLVLGEVFYYSGNLSAMAWVGGPGVYRGKTYADIAAGKYLNIAMQGARWQGVTAICPWTTPLPGVKPALQPRAVFIKEQNVSVYPNRTITRTIKVFNDTRFDDPITMQWQLQHNHTAISQGSKVYNIAAGHDQEDTLSVNIPQVLGDMDLMLHLTLSVNGQQVFADDHQLKALFTQQIKPQPGLAVYDPSGKVIHWLKQRQVPHVAIDSPTAINATTKTLLIGPGALDDRHANVMTDLIKRIKAAPLNVIVLEQSQPLTGNDLGVPLELADKKPDANNAAREEFEGAKGSVGQIAFVAAPAHPVFKDVTDNQLFTWAGGSWNFTNAYATPTGGMIPMISAGHDLNLCPMVQINSSRGKIILSQMLIGSKLGVEPMADRLLARLLNDAVDAANTMPARTAVLTDGDRQLEQLLKQTGLQYDAVNAIGDLLKRTPTHKVMIVKATAANMAWLKTNSQLLNAWANTGGRMMLVNLTADGLDDFNQLVGFPHHLRPGTQERVRLDNLANPLLLGISDRDIAMDSDAFIAKWRNQRYISDRVFSNVIDGDEIASFAQMNKKYSNIVNGLTNADFWRYICYLSPTESIRMSFDHPQRLEKMHLWTNDSYKVIKRIRLTFDQDPRTAMNIDLADTSDMQIIPLNGHTAQSLDIQLLEMFDKPSSKDLTGIDNLEIFRSIPDDMAKRFVMLASPGGLVEYPLGNGCLLLNNLDYQKPDTDVNRKKKLGIWSNLLRNMGATMGASQ